MMKAVATAVETADRAAGQSGVQPLYLEALTLVERLHRRLLDVIKDEFDRRGRADINSVQALLLYNIGDKELTAGELRTRGYYLGSNVSYNLKKLVELGFLDHQRSRVDRRSVRIRLTAQGQEVRKHRRCALPEARQDGGAGRRHLQRGVRDAEQVAAPPRAVLDRPDPVSALRIFGQAGAFKKTGSRLKYRTLPERAHFGRWPSASFLACGSLRLQILGHQNSNGRVFSVIRCARRALAPRGLLCLGKYRSQSSFARTAGSNSLPAYECVHRVVA